jgi:MoaA/NifB/PqqE/SkfB family radical SAM enzyme
MLPFSIVVSVSFRCNSKCKTCDVWRKPNDDMTVEEWDRVFSKMGRGPLYITFTGGEPFLRNDTADMVLSACSAPAITAAPRW